LRITTLKAITPSGPLIGSVGLKDRDVRVRYQERDSQTNGRSVQQAVRLDAGKRSWFGCPTCNQRTRTLFLVGPPFGIPRLVSEVSVNRILFPSGDQRGNEGTLERSPVFELLSRDSSSHRRVWVANERGTPKRLDLLSL
jgi:hypothetical protein